MWFVSLKIVIVSFKSKMFLGPLRIHLKVQVGVGVVKFLNLTNIAVTSHFSSVQTNEQNILHTMI
jgi:hypothetical protein